MADLSALLNERGKRYGDFADHAAISCAIKRVIGEHIRRRGLDLDDDMIESLDMIAHKIGRIVNGDPAYIYS